MWIKFKTYNEISGQFGFFSVFLPKINVLPWKMLTFVILFRISMWVKWLLSTVINKKYIFLQISGNLLKKETLNYDDVEKLIGPPLHGKKRLIDPVEFEASLKDLSLPSVDGGASSNTENT